MELRHNSALSEAHHKIQLLETQCHDLNESVLIHRRDLDTFEQKDRDRIEIQNRAVTAALTLREEEQRDSNLRQSQWVEMERVRVGAEAAAQILANNLQNKVSHHTLQWEIRL